VGGRNYSRRKNAWGKEKERDKAGDTRSPWKPGSGGGEFKIPKKGSGRAGNKKLVIRERRPRWIHVSACPLSKLGEIRGERARKTLLGMLREKGGRASHRTSCIFFKNRKCLPEAARNSGGRKRGA